MTDNDLTDGLLSYDPDKSVSLPGRKCAYCGCDLRRRTSTRDHVVARRFVPEGTLASGLSLQVKACVACNGRKAALEDDISLISMLPDTAGKLVRDDERLRRTVSRKSQGSISVATRKLAAQSYSRFNVGFPLAGNLSLTYRGVGMPTIDERRVAQLAYYHVQGFFSFRSFDRERGHGRWLEPNKFLLLGLAIDADWGNPRLVHVMDRMRAWEPTFIGNFADGYFRHAMRKAPDGELSAWALEWNGRFRVYGIYGPDADRASFVEGMPSLTMDLSYGDRTNGFGMRFDTPLAAADDTLFMVPAGYQEPPPAPPHWR